MCDTKTYEAFVRQHMGSHLNERACYALGLAGEAGEVCGEILMWDRDALRKELGDVVWYIVALAAQFNFDVERIWLVVSETYRHDAMTPPLARGLMLARDAGAVVDTLKKHWGHKKELDDIRLRGALGIVLGDVLQIADWYGLTLHEIRSANVAKLSARFPQGCFSTQAANAYADKAPSTQRSGDMWTETHAERDQ